MLAPGETKEIVFVLGEVENLEQIPGLVSAYAGRAKEALTQVQQEWDRLLSAVQVTTPDPGMDLMLNRWLPYQVLSLPNVGAIGVLSIGRSVWLSRPTARRDVAFNIAPQDARAHLLRSAVRQFEEGDVQHWWHPPVRAGVRTRITDDLYFLPLVVHHYVTTTGDTAFLDEVVPFIQAPMLREDQDEEFNLPTDQRTDRYAL